MILIVFILTVQNGEVVLDREVVPVADIPKCRAMRDQAIRGTYLGQPVLMAQCFDKGEWAYIQGVEAAIREGQHD